MCRLSAFLLPVHQVPAHDRTLRFCCCCCTVPCCCSTTMFRDAFDHVADVIDEVYKAMTKSDDSIGGTAKLLLENEMDPFEGACSVTLSLWHRHCGIVAPAAPRAVLTARPCALVLPRRRWRPVHRPTSRQAVPRLGQHLVWREGRRHACSALRHPQVRCVASHHVLLCTCRLSSSHMTCAACLHALHTPPRTATSALRSSFWTRLTRTLTSSTWRR